MQPHATLVTLPISEGLLIAEEIRRVAQRYGKPDTHVLSVKLRPMERDTEPDLGQSSDMDRWYGSLRDTVSLTRLDLRLPHSHDAFIVEGSGLEARVIWSEHETGLVLLIVLAVAANDLYLNGTLSTTADALGILAFCDLVVQRYNETNPAQRGVALVRREFRFLVNFMGVQGLLEFKSVLGPNCAPQQVLSPSKGDRSESPKSPTKTRRRTKATSDGSSGEGKAPIRAKSTGARTSSKKPSKARTQKPRKPRP